MMKYVKSLGKTAVGQISNPRGWVAIGLLCVSLAILLSQPILSTVGIAAGTAAFFAPNKS
jgi:hypothetical protein